jgi:hypothetical protein
MAEFESPRFAGDPVLEQILNDPDTGNFKLQPGSPSDSVTRLQQALFDLAWNMRIVPPQFGDGVPETFIDGVYGGRTTGCVLAYKQHYNLRFPPDDPGGFIDGLAGPRTFAKLDPQCVLIDEAAAAINARAAELGIAMLLLVRPAMPIDDTSGALNVAADGANRSTIYYKRGVGAVEVHGPIQEAYSIGIGAPSGNGPLGFPVAEERDDDVAGFRIQDFEFGSIRLDVAAGTTELVNLQPGDPGTPIF